MWYHFVYFFEFFFRPKITTETKDFTRFKINIYFAEQKINTSLTIDPDFSRFFVWRYFFGYYLAIVLQVPRLFSLFVPNQYYFYFKHDSCSAFMKLSRNVFMTFGNFILFAFSWISHLINSQQEEKVWKILKSSLFESSFWRKTEGRAKRNCF